jgi:hypothetical protein
VHHQREERTNHERGCLFEHAAWQVHLFAATRRTAAWHSRLPPEDQLNSFGMGFEQQITWPSMERVQAATGVDRDDAWRYFEIVASDDDPGPYHRMFGHPDEVQDGDMRELAQLAGHGLHPGDLSRREIKLRKRVLKDVNEWILLLQVDSDSAVGFPYGRLYFWIRRQDLAVGRTGAGWATIEMD